MTMDVFHMQTMKSIMYEEEKYNEQYTRSKNQEIAVSRDCFPSSFLSTEENDEWESLQVQI